MKMTTTCVIDFENNPDKVVGSGQSLRGTVTLTLTENRSVRGIFIKLIGKACVNWSALLSDEYASTKRKNEYYLNEKAYLVGSEEGEIMLSAGTCSFNFEVELPPRLPTSVEGKNGFIRYRMSVLYDMRMLPNEKIYETRFTVIKSVNLNENRAFNKPLTANVENTFVSYNSIFCCVSHLISPPLIMTVHTPVSAYVPGECINLRLTATNKSCQPIHGFTIQLVKEIGYYVNNKFKPKVESFVINETKTRSGCNKGEYKTMHIVLDVPRTLPTDCSTSHIIKVRYYCRIIGLVSRWHKNPMLHLPITIGTHPFLDIVNNGRESTNNEIC